MSIPPLSAASSHLLDGPAGPLEVAIDAPITAVAALPITAVICHPLSIEGGSFNNKVVTQTARALRELGITAVRFNFRSVGASAGRFDAGEGEQDDLRCVVQWWQQQRPDHALWLAGFSFGAYVSLRASATLQPQALISIAPPVGRGFWDFGVLHTPPQWLVIQGNEDEIVDASDVRAWLAGLAAPPQQVFMDDTSHFFHGKLPELRHTIQQQVRAWLPSSQTTD